MPKELSEITRLDQLRSLMISSGVTRLLFKRLAPNDNSKNQIYLGGDYSALQILPYSDVTADVSRTDSKRDRFKAKVSLHWLGANGRLSEAPTTQLVLYPKYPEVRLSGFLNRAEFRPSRYLRSRDLGRILFLGITNDDRIVGHVIGGENPLSHEIESFIAEEGKGVLAELPLRGDLTDTRGELLNRLTEIYNRGWISSVKLDREGNSHPYSALNGGGYTLEAQFGVIPNGTNEPDFLGWEIKQHKSPRLNNPLMGGALTLMTPEPTGGHYKDQGAESFVRTFGYPDMRGRLDRLNFGGIHRFKQEQALTGLTLLLDGFDVETGKIIDINGGIVLQAADGEYAAVWYYRTLIEKWTRKHAKAAYIPSHSRKRDGKAPEYRYGHVIGLGERSSISNFLGAMALQSIYYDPGIKLENASTAKPKIKKRSQFRISAKNLPSLYAEFELVDIAAMS